jgi:hypothetical protein
LERPPPQTVEVGNGFFPVTLVPKEFFFHIQLWAGDARHIKKELCLIGGALLFTLVAAATEPTRHEALLGLRISGPINSIKTLGLVKQ